jgi:hypothetical protein
VAHKNSADMRTAAKSVRLALLRLRVARRYNVKSIDPEVAMRMADEIRHRAGQKAKAMSQDISGDIRELRGQASDIDKAWGKWNWRDLANLNVVSKDDAEFVMEVSAMYSW